MVFVTLRRTVTVKKAVYAGSQEGRRIRNGRRAGGLGISDYSRNSAENY